VIYKNIKNLLYKFEPEVAHLIGEKFMHYIESMPVIRDIWRTYNTVDDRRLHQNILGIDFKNPVGLGAGFDKKGSLIREMRSLGFGFSEIGTITPKPQEGNPKPRIYRHLKEETLQNAMGFNNDGMEIIKNRISNLAPFVIPVGINIGKNKITSEETAINDYLILIEKFHHLASYLVINISSPNTPNLRNLQNEKFIKALFSEGKKITTKPIFLKIAPDLSIENAINLSNFAVESGANGIIATNTTIDHSLIKNVQSFGGGLSGKVLRDKSFKLFEAIAKELYGKTVLISVGGIDSAEETYKRLQVGASLIQIYSALIFKGPSLPSEINRGILKLMRRDGYSHISEVIGSKLRK